MSKRLSNEQRAERARQHHGRELPRERERIEREQRRRAHEDKRERDQQRVLHDELRPPSIHAGFEDTTIAIGASAEERAVAALASAGYEIVERNYRCDVGELDIIARDGDELVFVEVRSRSDDEHGTASEAVGRTKRRKVTRVAEVYLRHRRPRFETCRFDVVAINGDEVEIYTDAWRGGLLF
jgi:putative endonuclease